MSNKSFTESITMVLPKLLLVVITLFRFGCAVPTQHANNRVVPGENCDPESYMAEKYLMPPYLPFLVEVIAVFSPKEAPFTKEQFLSIDITSRGVLAIDDKTNHFQYSESKQDVTTFWVNENGHLTTANAICGFDLAQGVALALRGLSCPVPHTLNKQSGHWSFQSACIDNTVKILLLPPRENDIDPASKRLWSINRESTASQTPKTIFCYPQLDKTKSGKHYIASLSQSCIDSNKRSTASNRSPVCRSPSSSRRLLSRSLNWGRGG
jgi:hypothetical protein